MYNLDFSLEDEIEVTKHQVNAIERYAIWNKADPSIIDLAKEIMWTDIAGQRLFYAKHNKFVYDQEAFVKNEI